MQSTDIIEHFHGVYLLYCKNPKYLGHTYIGYTVDPNRRIKQHNKGMEAGGAWRTSKRGPWSMAMIIHGFPNNVSALRFEWAWQHPQRSTRLNHLRRKAARERPFQYRFRVLCEMLRVGPWKRLPLTVRWLDDELAQEFPLDKAPPVHMPIVYGSLIAKRLKDHATGDEANAESGNGDCFICSEKLEKPILKCLDAKCPMQSHIGCLADRFLEPTEYVPVSGECPKCSQHFLWGDLIRKLSGCYGNTEETGLKRPIVADSSCSDNDGESNDNDDDGISVMSSDSE